MVSSLETDTPTNPYLIISIPVKHGMIIISSLKVDISTNPGLIISMSPLYHLELIVISSLETDTPTNRDLIILIPINPELNIISRL